MNHPPLADTSLLTFSLLPITSLIKNTRMELRLHAGIFISEVIGKSEKVRSEVSAKGG